MTKGYRLRIYDTDDSTVVATVTAGIESYVDILPQSVRPLEGKVVQPPVSVTLVDATMPSWLRDSDGFPVAARRLADISDTTDGGSTYTVRYTGRIQRVRLARNRAVFQVTLADERTLERNTTLFEGQNTTQILWPGLVNAYGPFDPPEDILAIPGNQKHVNRSGRNAPVTTVTGVWGPTPLRVFSILKDDLTPGVPDFVGFSAVSGGSFDNLRFNIAGTDYEVVAFGAKASGWWVRGWFDAFEDIVAVRVYDPSNAIPTGASEGYLHLPTRDPDKDLPYHIDTDHAFQHLKDIYDDIGIRYDTSALGTYDASTNPQGLVDNPRFPDMRFRITAPENAASFLEQNIYQCTGVVPLIGEDGRVVPTSVLMPAADIVPDVNTLFEFNHSNSSLGDGEIWDHDSRDQVTVVRITYMDEQEHPIEEDREVGLDGIRATEKTIEYEDTALVTAYGRHVLDLKPLGVPGGPDNGPAAAEALLNWIGPAVIDRFGYGPIRTTLKCLESTAGVDDVAVGEWVTLNFNSYPNLGTGARGGTRLMQVLSKGKLVEGWQFELLDAGPKSQPLSAPTVSAALNTLDPAHTINVTISGLGTGEHYELHAARNASEPAESSSLWKQVATGTANETIAVGAVRSNTKYWFRARATKRQRISSAWSTAVSATTDALSPPTNLQVSNVTGTTADLTWDLGERTSRIEILLDGSVVAERIVGTTKHTLRDLSLSTTYNSPGVQVRHKDKFGGVSSSATATFTTLGTQPQLSKLRWLRVIQGADSNKAIAT